MLTAGLDMRKGGGGDLGSMGPFVVCKHGHGKCLMGSKGVPAGYERDQSYLEIPATLANCLVA